MLPSDHYLTKRLARLKRLQYLAVSDKIMHKALQAHRLVNQLTKIIANHSSINLPYIKQNNEHNKNNHNSNHLARCR